MKIQFPHHLSFTGIFALSLFLLMGMSEITADYETDASLYPGDSVDDIALWVHPENPEQSLILATLKRSNLKPPLPTGLLVYDLHGKQKQFLKGGSPNNIDIRPGFSWMGDRFQLIIASHWSSNDVNFYKVDKNSLELFPLLDNPIKTSLKLTRGLCMYKSGNYFYYFAVSNEGLIHQYQITTFNGELSARRIRKIKLDSRSEGCVVDDDNHRVYFAEESVGIWRMDTRPNRGNSRTLIDSTSFFGDLYRDIEGITLYRNGDGSGYLIASSQMKNRFVIYDRLTNKKIGVFKVIEGKSTDGATYTDGIMANHSYLGDNFPSGIFVVQDNDNIDKNGNPQNQNFKIIDWRKMKNLIEGFGK